MNVFTASNGVELRLNEDGFSDEYLDFRSNGPTWLGMCGGKVVQALREFFQAEADERLGRWRWPVDHEYIALPRERTATPGEKRRVRVIHEPSGDLMDTVEGSALVGVFKDVARAYFDAHPEPKPQGVHMLSYDFCKTLPVGSSVVDFEGYWAGRCYVKTSDATWAYFSSRPEVGTHWRAVDERRNNLSPGPSDYWAHVYDPPERPKPWHEAAPGEVWDVDLPSGGMRAVTFYSARHDEPITVFRDAHTQIEIETDDPDIRDARCLFSEARGIWPEVS